MSFKNYWVSPTVILSMLFMRRILLNALKNLRRSFVAKSAPQDDSFFAPQDDSFFAPQDDRFIAISCKRILGLLLFCFSAVATASGETRHFPSGTQSIYIAETNSVRSDLLKNIAPLVENSIKKGRYPGAVILAAHRGQIIYRGVFGNRRIIPNVAPMRFDTIFDVASLTKVVATTPAVMQLLEKNKLELDAPVAKYWPAFAANGKENITIRELLTHTSGLPPDVSLSEKNILRQVEKISLRHYPGTTFLYSDVNFIALAHVVEIVSGERFNQYVQNHIFKPLGMKDTTFLPSSKIRDRIAPTELVKHELRWGQVQDPTAFAAGGVSGNAGLFSSAKDLATYAQCLLDNGHIANSSKKYLLGPLTILKMISPQTPATMTDLHGLGWDIDSSFSSRGILFPINSYGHTGWTGTSIWIDPSTQTWLIILASRAHPTPEKHNQLVQDRRAIANIISASITDISILNQNNTGPGELSRAYRNARENIQMAEKK